ncbi:hypothetical protein N0O92_04655 [Alkalihalobacillus sp. MEB130]|uniref:hypothetical protein n=1 Tax=Alkalihalobacillus sp. MEB130 TaxID=2976704 RepID=UPI0028DDDA12|nr:hypothetical protein [Alkalihalobacillus sp. MEB130]MDT8859514.1 hypothetical protein [Alkalihalobacillus sp. MEB130]
MKINIDLLPQKTERKDSTVLIIPVAGAVMIFLLAIYVTVSFIHLSSSVAKLGANVEEQTAYLDELNVELLEKQTGTTAYNFVDHYTQLEHVLHSIYQDATVIRKELFSFLPTETEVNEYDYDHAGNVTMVVTFSSKEDAAIYLNRLLHVDMVMDAKIETISLVEQNGFRSLLHVELNSLVGDKQ